MDDFYQPDVLDTPILSGEEFKHCIRVLRNKEGDEIGIFDGKGHYFITQITSIAKQQCELKIVEKLEISKKSFSIHLVIAPTKSMDRMEWMIEKLGELGVDEVTFIHTQHAERPKIKLDRLEKKAIAALKQSKNGYLMKINPLIRMNDFLKTKTNPKTIKCLAIVKDNLPYMSQVIQSEQPVEILIGPEGDFSSSEIEQAIKHRYELISLGNNTLRTETAGLIASHIIHVKNYS